ncbi:MAG: M23 family metallopeptidase [Dysgonamonadaceae bacterium]|jgi:murein DD-endopeptidase MepM/ murein hydrolase activator NlpD|nr:M23 family metallopeptidase [Dysgonamonadaceae bacterium]
MKHPPLLSILLSCLLSCLFCTTEGHAQQAILPMDIPPLLSGNFGELRTNHFHSGIDFKTSGKTGIPVRAVMDGFVSRINVSPRGYGRALYVDHPDGTTTVYGHLERFNKAIASFTLDSQYVKHSYTLDILLPPHRFPVKQGDIIAYSGNTGGSSGPHLHFELRETASQKIKDPAILYLGKIKDTVRPRIHSFMIYPQEGEGVVNGTTRKQPILIRRNRKTGAVSVSPHIKVWGKAGFALKAYDYMNNTRNAYGVKDITLKIDNRVVFHSGMNSFSFDETRYLNSFIDWEEWTYRKSFYIKSFVEPGNKFPSYRMEGDGIFTFNREKTYTIACILKDAWGNSETFHFTVQGVRQTVPPRRPLSDNILFPCKRENVFTQDGVSLRIPTGKLYTDLYFRYGITRNYTPFSPLYSLHERWPLHAACPLTIDIVNDTMPQKEKYGIVSVHNGKQQWIGGRYRQGKISADIRELGAFAVAIDTVPPTITPIHPESWPRNRKITFKVADAQSGISSWTASVDGQFVLFEPDNGQGLLLSCPLNARNMREKGRLKLTVCDACGNESVHLADYSL